MDRLCYICRLWMGYVILLWHSLSLPYDYFIYQLYKLCNRKVTKIRSTLLHFLTFHFRPRSQYKLFSSLWRALAKRLLEHPVFHLISDNNQNNFCHKAKMYHFNLPSRPKLYLPEHFTYVQPFHIGLPVQILTKILRGSCHLILCKFTF